MGPEHQLGAWLDFPAPIGRLPLGREARTSGASAEGMEQVCTTSGRSLLDSMGPSNPSGCLEFRLLKFPVRGDDLRDLVAFAIRGMRSDNKTAKANRFRGETQRKLGLLTSLHTQDAPHT